MKSYTHNVQLALKIIFRAEKLQNDRATTALPPHHLLCQHEHLERELASSCSKYIKFLRIILLKCSHTHSFTFCLWLPSHYNGIVMTEILWPTKPQMFSIWSFTDKVCWPLIKKEVILWISKAFLTFERFLVSKTRSREVLKVAHSSFMAGAIFSMT